MKSKLWRCMLIVACSFIFGLLLQPPMSLQAATASVTTIKAGEGDDCGLCKYDFNGDGYADTIKIYDYEVSEEDGYTVYDQGKVTLNGNTVLTFSIDEEYGGYGAKLIVLKNGKKFLLLDYDHVEDDYQYNLYQYSNGQFKYLTHINDLFNYKYGSMNGIASVKASGNTLSLYMNYNSRTFGKSIVKYNYVYKSGTLKKSPSYGWITRITQKKSGKCFNSNTMVTKKSIKAYKSATSNKKYKTIKKGKKVRLDRFYYSSKYGVRIRVKYSGKYMWIKGVQNWSSTYFKYAYQFY